MAVDDARLAGLQHLGSRLLWFVSLLQVSLSGVALVVPSQASAATITVSVSGDDDPFLAGRPNGYACCGGDAAPAQSPTLALTGFATGHAITFSAVGGFSYTGGAPFATADGGAPLFNMTSYAGISGPDAVNASGLVGVFLPGVVNSGAPPAKRNDGLGFASISPALYQVFWIGDGLTGTGSGAVQQFIAPAGATRLFLGSADGSGWYNNTGTASVTITYTPVPEPGSGAMMLAGLVAIRLWRRGSAGRT
jgi:hypothetical protein